MIAWRVAHGVLHKMPRLWSVWAVVCGCAAVLVHQTFPAATSLVVGCASGLPVSLVVHEYGHARVARSTGAQEIRVVRVRGAVAVVHEARSAERDRLAALGGPLASAVGGALLWCAAVRTGSGGLGVTAILVASGAASLWPTSHDGRRIWSGRPGQRPPLTR